ncbi:uncharacterized protein LOC101864142 isoform X1 [Aplysia californica]|uniref:Uncharacterized protein LOC101864142 isoform X1 n=1 Tax=Aplysia californica TaxID=6500 RepID=A0ABM1VT40_APLCA|nr:uncharacterized protein LOC101864142 isoform X1 [Aplysia californica]XP_035825583.1 uncharacterized protein LOC101864142 isoform X1 [Aplysia californica]
MQITDAWPSKRVNTMKYPSRLLVGCICLSLMFVTTSLVQANIVSSYLDPSKDCGWTYDNYITFGVLRMANPPSHNGSNVSCVFNLSTTPGSYFKLTINNFSLGGSDVCGENSEKVSVEFDQDPRVPQHWPDRISWCGKKRPDVMWLPSTVKIVYNTGLNGRGEGFEMTFEVISKDRQDFCDGFSRLQIDKKHGKLLYAPGYPFEMITPLKCNWTLTTSSGYGMVVRVLALGAKTDYRSCFKDYLKVGAKKFCDFVTFGTENIYIKEMSTTVELSISKFGFESGSQQEMVLDVSSVLKSSRCSDVYHYFSDIVLTEAVVLEMDKQSRKTSCEVRFDSGSDDKVIEYNLLAPSTMISLLCKRRFFSPSMIFYLEDDDGTVFNVCSFSMKVFRSSGRRLVFTLRRYRTYSFADIIASFQAVDKFPLPRLLLSSLSSAVHIPQAFLASEREREREIHLQLGLTPYIIENSRDAVTAIKIFNNNWTEELTPANMLKMFNGPNVDYFELTKDCNGDPRSEKTLYSKGTWLVTVQILADLIMPDGFWLVVLPVKFKPLYTNSLKNNVIELKKHALPFGKNLHCFWKVSNSSNTSIQSVKLVRSDDGVQYEISELLASGKRRNPPLIAAPSHNESQSYWIYSLHNIEVYVRILPDPTQTTRNEYFLAQYKVITSPASVAETSSCLGTELHAEQATKTASSPSYPNYIMTDLQCEWRIKKRNTHPGISVAFRELPQCEKSSSDVYIKVNSQNLCGKEVFFRTYESDEVKVELSSGHSLGSLPGFSYTYRSVYPSVFRSCNETFRLSSSAPMKRIVEHLKPEFFSGSLSCWWRITAPSPDSLFRMEIHNLSFGQKRDSIDCTNELELRDAESHKFIYNKCDDSEQNKLVRHSFSQHLLVSLHLGEEFEHDFFMDITFTAVKNTGCEGVTKTLNASQEEKTFEWMFKNSDCTWKIAAPSYEYKSVEVKVVELSLNPNGILQCGTQLLLSNSKYFHYSDSHTLNCDSQNIPYVFTSERQFVYVRVKHIHHSGSDSQGLGFRLEYRALGYESNDSSDSSSIKKIIGGVTGVAMVLLIFTCVCVCIVKRRKAKREQRLQERQNRNITTISTNDNFSTGLAPFTNIVPYSAAATRTYVSREHFQEEQFPEHQQYSGARFQEEQSDEAHPLQPNPYSEAPPSYEEATERDSHNPSVWSSAANSHREIMNEGPPPEYSPYMPGGPLDLQHHQTEV